MEGFIQQQGPMGSQMFYPILVVGVGKGDSRRRAISVLVYQLTVIKLKSGFLRAILHGAVSSKHFGTSLEGPAACQAGLCFQVTVELCQVYYAGPSSLSIL